jgi:hypothetical protein
MQENGLAPTTPNAPLLFPRAHSPAPGEGEKAGHHLHGRSIAAQPAVDESNLASAMSWRDESRRCRCGCQRASYCGTPNGSSGRCCSSYRHE